MNFLNSLLIVCSALFAVAQSWQIDDNTWPKSFEKLSSDSVTLLGRGIDQNRLVFVECRKANSASCAIFVRNHESCNVMVGNRNNANVKSVVQPSANKVIIVSNSAPFLYTFVDVDKCRSKNLQLNATDVIGVVYENGFDVMKRVNTRVRFDLSGNPILERPTVFQVPKNISKLYPVSIRWRSKGFFFATSNETHLRFSILQDDGAEYKKLLEIGVDDLVAEDASQQLYTICWKDNNTDADKIHCAQFDELGNEKYRKQIDNPESERLFAIRNLRNGGFARFAYSKSSMKVLVTVIYLDRVAEQSTYDVDAKTDEMSLADFYEKGGTFVLSYVPEDATRGFAMQKYKLPGTLAPQVVVQP